VADHREAGKAGDMVAELLIHSRGGVGISLFDIRPDVGTVLFRLGRPDNPHA
jgi:hypothetical protein